MGCLDHGTSPKMPWGFTGGVVSLYQNIIARTFRDHIFSFIDNADIKSMRSAIKFGEYNDAVSQGVAEFITGYY